ncbi:transketolase [Frankia sp. Cr2]|uniref:transketolase n=1 Tax=Frankia sp. Cr2 TaxID=3073932 RepID=UPI002AD4C068|nr:transketolase [Frankia sp. Cr2]
MTTPAAAQPSAPPPTTTGTTTTGTLGVLQRDREVTPTELRRRAEWIRLETIRLVGIAGSGHYSSTFSAAELFAVLYYRVLQLAPADPAWPDRDRLLLGKGHAAVGLYPCLADLGFFPTDWLDSYTRLGSPLGDHPDMTKVPGVDFSSGSIGHNLSVGLGMALAARLSGRGYRTYVVLGDGELHEGQVYEAMMAASHFRLGNLVAVVDANGSCLDGPTSQVMNVEPIAGRFDAFGWRTVELDGHDVEALVTAFATLPPPTDDQPTCVVARTVKGMGVSFMESAEEWHLGFLGPADRERAEQEIRERLA